MKLKDKVVIITGATAGIGRSSAIIFAAEGAKVVAAGRSVEKGNSLVDEIKAAGGEAIYVPTDVLKEEDLDNLVKAAIDTYGRIDVLFNNAGVAYTVPLEEMTQDKWDWVLNMNTRSLYMLTKKCMPYILESKGNILNTSSIAGLKATAYGYAYNTSKYAVNGLTKCLAADYAAQGIRVNAICPGLTLTDILSQVDEAIITAASATIPMKRLAEPEEIAKVALFVVSDDASFMTGQTIAVDGGMTL
ncbi:MAG: glucose 1-dehydrogenase [Lachnospiraceae bacterium]|nr:glucose 1-dehydrogenase [Lachnospiraceae bacterium]